MPTDWDATIDAGGTATTLDAIDGWTEHESLLGLLGDAVPQLASASTTSIAAGDAEMRREVEITGTTGISSFGAADAGMVRALRFVSAGCTVNHSSAILCPGGASITSEAGTRLVVWKLDTSDDWRVVDVFHPSALVTVGAALPPGTLFGLTLSNNATDATNDIDIATGKARDGDDSANLVLASALTRISAISRSTNSPSLTSLTLMTSISLCSCLVICSIMAASPLVTRVRQDTSGS